MTSTPTVYIDLDGTLLGHRASLLHNHEGTRSNVAIDALVRLEDAGCDVVVATGRDIYRTSEFCRAVGIEKYIAELGCVVHTTGEDIIVVGEHTEEFMASRTLSHEQLLPIFTDAASQLIEKYSGALEFHTPYNRDRYASVLLRGNIDVDEANSFLHDSGWSFLKVVANGHGMFRRTMPGVDNVLIYHVSPIDMTKATGITYDQQLRALDPSHCFMIGDGMADAQCHEVVSKVFIPSNGIASDPDMKAFADTHDNIVTLDASHNEGFAQAVDNILSNK